MAKLKPAASVPASATAAAGASEATNQDTTQAGTEPTENVATDGDTTESTGDATQVEQASLYPRTVRVMNNGPIALAEPVSGVYVGPGGSQETVLHDEDHAHRVLENFGALLEANFLQPEVLRIDGLPE